MELARALGANAKTVKAEEELIRETDSNEPSLVILDLASSDYDPFSCAKKLKTKRVPPKILGIFPHVRADLRLSAQEAKIDYIVPNSSFLQTLKSVLQREVLK